MMTSKSEDEIAALPGMNAEAIEIVRSVYASTASDGASGEVLLTGGAAMCLVHSARDMTDEAHVRALRRNGCGGYPFFDG